MRGGGGRLLILLLAIVAIAAGLRLWRLGSSPPGINQDEATSIWNAHCLATTGQDQSGARWPIFYARMFGQNQTTLFLYYLIPFEAIGGASVVVARAAAATSAIAAILLVAYIGARMFGGATGLIAAALLALNPWHVQQSHWAHDTVFTPFIVALAWAALVWCGLAPDSRGDDPPRPRPLRAALAGAVFGIGCYGYQSVRMFLPLFLVAVVLLAWRRWVAYARAPRGTLAICALAVAWIASFAPLAWRHLADPFINKRAVDNWVWAPNDAAGAKVSKVAARYLSHFDVSSLFVHSNMLDYIAPPAGGLIDWYVLPLLLAGVFVAARRARFSSAHRILLAALLLYPAGDTVNSAPALHPLRSLPGICGIFLVAAVGAVEGGRWLRSVRPRLAWVALALLATTGAAELARGYHAFFGEFNRRPWTVAAFHADLVEACAWLRPRLDTTDAVFITTTGMNMPYVVAMVALDYDPREWFRGERRTFTIEPWEYCAQVGKICFMYVGHDDTHDVAWDALAANATRDRVIVIARPGEIDLGDPVETIRDDRGEPRLLIHETTL